MELPTSTPLSIPSAAVPVTAGKKKITRNILIIVGAAAVLTVVYFIFFKKGSTDSTSSLQTVAGSDTTPTLSTGDIQVTSQQFLSELLNIDSIKIDDSIVTNPAFTVLVDLSNPIEPDTNPGRINPFAPLGSDSAAVSTQVATNDPTLKLATSAVLNGTLSVSGPNITRWFEYGTTDSLGTKTKEIPQANAGIYSESITGLLPDTTYYVKAVASIGGQTISGALTSWHTAQIKRTGQ